MGTQEPARRDGEPAESDAVGTGGAPRPNTGRSTEDDTDPSSDVVGHGMSDQGRGDPINDGQSHDAAGEPDSSETDISDVEALTDPIATGPAINPGGAEARTDPTGPGSEPAADPTAPPGGPPDADRAEPQPLPLPEPESKLPDPMPAARHGRNLDPDEPAARFHARERPQRYATGIGQRQPTRPPDPIQPYMPPPVARRRRSDWPVMMLTMVIAGLVMVGCCLAGFALYSGYVNPFRR